MAKPVINACMHMHGIERRELNSAPEDCGRNFSRLGGFLSVFAFLLATSIGVACAPLAEIGFEEHPGRGRKPCHEAELGATRAAGFVRPGRRGADVPSLSG